ncbi:hypothetical protein MSG28_010806 [Choristoneura fumiferana]|uniref:Uncharacterized protein n=1 Tax=Choristoneura fumiferana TaxID=7141 RepID=A0ACC0KPI8_CHOFU|nr:hypothetical protein MSG28_010806 [Choristoneura fumiferana]
MNNPQTGVSDVRSLKPQGGGHVYAESDVNFKSSSSNNGQYASQSGGHKVINNDGAVSEYDYKP